MRLAAILLAAALAAACGNPDKRLDCSGTSGCPAGFYCASEGVCWPDSTPPVVGTVSASCVAPCARDGALHVTAQASDAARMGSVRVRLDLDPSRTVTLPRTAAGWEGDVPLAAYPFPGFEQAIAVTVEAVDEAGNVKAKAVEGTVAVTRVKWVYEAGGSPASVAVYPDGSVLLANGSPDRLARVGANGRRVWAASVGTSDQGVPSIGSGVAWVGNAAGIVFAVGDDGAVLNGAGCSTGDAVLVPPAVNAAGTLAFASSLSGSFSAVGSPDVCRSTTGPARISAAGVIGAAGAIYSPAFSSQTLTSVLRKLTFGGSSFADEWFGLTLPQVSFAQNSDVRVPLAIEASGSVLTLSTDGKLTRSQSNAAAAPVADVSSGDAGPVVLADNSIVVADAAGTVRRLSSAGAPLWPTSPVLGAVPQTPLVMTGGEAVLVVPTAGGKLFALAADGTEVWSTQLATASTTIRPGNIFTPAGSPVSLGYFPASNGKLYAVVLDGRLDASAPWPKAFHDPRNTGNAATPIP